MAKVQRGHSKAAVADARRRFVEAYLTNGGNATNAAMQAGYSARTAYSSGSRLLKSVEESGELETRRAELTRSRQLSAQDVLARAHAIDAATLNSFLDGKGKLLAPGEWPAEWRCAVQAYEITRYGPRIKLHDKSGARDLLAKYHGLVNAELEKRVKALEALLQEGNR